MAHTKKKKNRYTLCVGYTPCSIKISYLVVVVVGHAKRIAIVFALLILNLCAVKVFLINLGDVPSYSSVHIKHMRAA